MRGEPSQWILTVLALAFTIGVPASATDTSPAGILLAQTGKAEFQRAGTSTWLQAKAGMVLSPGDTLRTAEGTIRFAYCREKSVQTLPPQKTLVIPASDLAAVAGAGLRDRTGIAYCDLPVVPETDGTMSRGGLGPPAAAKDCSGERVDLLDALNQAAQAIAAGDRAAALSTYEKIACYEGATWTRGVAARIIDQQQAASPQSGGQTYALLIGISDYPKETPQGPLKFAHSDAQTFAQFLADPRGGRLPAGHIKLLTNEQATLAGIEEAVSTFVRAARNPDNTLILLLAGHADYLSTKVDPSTGRVLEQAPFFLTYDSYAQEQNTTGLRLSRFRDILAEQALSFRRVIAYVDVCHAGHLQDASDRELPEAVQSVFVENQGLLGLMMATTTRGVAFESEKFGGGHGAFTYAVLEGLDGAVAPNERNQITFDDLYNHVFSRVRFLTNNVQTPGELDVRFRPIVLENATTPPTRVVGEATPMSKDATGRRERGKAIAASAEAPPSPPVLSAFDRLLRVDPLAAAAELDRAAAANTLPADVLLDRGEQLRIELEDRGQQILIRYLRGEQNAMVKADFALCAAYFGAALERAPFNAFDESRLLFCQGRATLFDRTPPSYAAATGLLERAILLDPNRSYAYNALGIAYLEQARGDAANYDKAIAAFQDAIRFAPQWAYPLHNLALTLSERGEFLAASRAYQQAMRLAPNYSYLPYNLGLLNQNVNRLDDAERLYRQAIDTAERARVSGIEPAKPAWRERAVIWNALATVEIARNRFKQAAAYLERARVDDESLPARKHNLALVLSRKGPSADAERLWREAISDDSPGLASRVALAEYLQRNQRPNEAITEFQALLANLNGSSRSAGFPKLDEVRKQLPFDPAMLELYGDTAARFGESADAVAGYDAAIREYRSRKDRQRAMEKRDRLATPSGRIDATAVH